MPSSAAFCSASSLLSLRQSQHLDAIAAQAFDVRRSDEACPGHTHSDGLFGELFVMHDLNSADRYAPRSLILGVACRCLACLHSL